MLSRVRTLRLSTLAFIFLAIGFMALVPVFFGGSRLYLNVFIFANVAAILAMSWDMLSGYTGQISFGHSVFFGIGGYTAALAGKELGLLPYMTIPLAGILAMVVGLLIAFPALRLKGPYLSLLTLIAAVGMDKVVRLLPRIFPSVFGSGAEGAIINDFLAGKLIPIISRDPAITYWVSLAIMLAIAVVLVLIAKSRIGLAFEAIRDDEEAAEAAGLNIAKYKVLAFAISGFVGGISGSIYVHHLQSASPASVFNLQVGLEAVVASVLGGMGTILGPIGGAYILVIARDILLRPVFEYRFLILFSLAFLILFIIPRGILTAIRLRLLKWIKAGRPPIKATTQPQQAEAEQ